MELFESGQLDITIEELDFSEKIRNPHKILPDDSPKIVKTVISGNTIKFYDANGKLTAIKYEMVSEFFIVR